MRSLIALSVFLMIAAFGLANTISTVKAISNGEQQEADDFEASRQLGHYSVDTSIETSEETPDEEVPKVDHSVLLYAFCSGGPCGFVSFFRSFIEN